MKVFKVLGLMSGTSLDGLDLALCHFWKKDGDWHYEFNLCKTVPYQDPLRRRLQKAILLESDELAELDQEYGRYLGQESAAFLQEYGLTVDCIASHGHTVHHRPDMGFTLQIGSGQQIANTSGYLTICDFRSKDISLGGQGAPLVPIGDQMFFHKYTFCLNLGGIVNISFVDKEQRLAFDIGIGNMLLNHISQQMALAYDEGGQLARDGVLNEELLAELNRLQYYQLPHPKSTGFEWFTEEILPIVEAYDLPVPDALHTAVHHICDQIADQIHRYAKSEENTVLVTGGGAFNTFLIDTLREKTSDEIKIVVPDPDLVSYKEALVFAFMGLLRKENEINVLCSVTGAKQDSSSGVIFRPETD